MGRALRCSGLTAAARGCQTERVCVTRLRRIIVTSRTEAVSTYFSTGSVVQICVSVIIQEESPGVRWFLIGSLVVAQ